MIKFTKIYLIKIITLSLPLFFFITKLASAESGIQVLDLTAAASTDSEEDCGRYHLKFVKIFLSNSPASESNGGGNISIVNEQGNAITTKHLSADQEGRLEVGIEQTPDQEVKDLKVLLRFNKDSDEFVNYEKVNVSKESDQLVRKINFEKPLRPGNYQIAISCRSNFLPIAAIVGGGAAIGGIVAGTTHNGNVQPNTPSNPIPEVNTNPTSNANDDIASASGSGSSNDDGSSGGTGANDPPAPPLPNDQVTASP